jgi:hypothetical protein
MINIKGYKQVEYKHFIKSLCSHFEESGKNQIEIATKIGSKTPNTVRNAMLDYSQVVSDQKLSKICEVVGKEGFILWINGEKYFYEKQ